jgi:hypothetical protein
MGNVNAISPLVTRRALLRGALASGGAAALGGVGYALSRTVGGDSPPFLSSWRVSTGADGAVRRFHSAPDIFPAATRRRVEAAGRAAGGYLFVGPAAVGGAQSGPQIVDDAGDPVWFRAQSRQGSGSWVTNVGVQSYRGAPVLTWWEGQVAGGYGRGEAVILDTAYREVARVRAANGRQMDLHELLLTDRGTALFTCAPAAVEADLSAIGGASNGCVLESIFQEVEVHTGRLVREWQSLRHVEPAESYRTPSGTFDYLHLNSIDVTPDGNLLVSARHTWALYKLERESGAVMWRLGGKRTQFNMGTGAQFAWQHDARQPDALTLTVFDDGDDGVTRTHASRGLLLDLDETGHRVEVTRGYTRPNPLTVSAMGSARRLSDGNMLVGWGSQPFVTEFDADGADIADLRIGTSPAQKSYRGFRQTWTAEPSGTPALAVRREKKTGHATAYVSWNGATEVTRWRLDVGTRRNDLRAVGVVPRRGFETAVSLGANEGYVAVAALDAHGSVLRHSPVVAV